MKRTVSPITAGGILRVIPVLIFLAGTAFCAGASPREEVRSLLTTYFESWSRGDMKTYRSLFHPDAVICHLQDGRVNYMKKRDIFVDEQSEIIAASTPRLTERMLSADIQADTRAATAVVTWELNRGSSRTRGMDRFTLIRERSGKWKIIMLLFYETD